MESWYELLNVKTLCLGVLTQGDATGYEIKKTFETKFSHFFAASFGSIYPALAKVTGDGLVTCLEHAQDKRPDKKVYSITPAGRLAFLDDLLNMPARDRIRSEFLAIMLYATLLPPRHIEELIDDRIARYQRTIAHMETGGAGETSAGEQFVHGFGLAVYKAALAYIEDNRHVVEGASLLVQMVPTAGQDGSAAAT